jgi:hypothetical protein
MDLTQRMKAWRRRGTRVVWDVDDYHRYQPAADVVTIGSQRLRELYPDGVFIPDALDTDSGAPVKQHHAELRRVCWYGISANLYHAQPVYEACLQLGLELTVITDIGSRKFSKARYLPWSLESVDRDIVACDLVACPYVFDGDWSASWVKAKGENRLLKAWGLGMPVVGTPIQSYLDCGLKRLATTTKEWVDALDQMRSPATRSMEAENGRQQALRHTADRVAASWLEVFKCID